MTMPLPDIAVFFVPMSNLSDDELATLGQLRRQFAELAAQPNGMMLILNALAVAGPHAVDDMRLWLELGLQGPNNTPWDSRDVATVIDGGEKLIGMPQFM